MKFATATAAALATLLGTASAGSRSDERTFAVLRFNGKEITKGRMDPLVSFGKPSGHVHAVMGADGFGMSANGDSLAQSTCTNAEVKGDNSAYWFPALYFQDPQTKKFEPVEIFYVNVYYFFDGTDDDIKAFPKGLGFVSGNAQTRVALVKTGDQNLDPADGPVQPVQWTCPRSDYNPPSWPAGSDGSRAGIGDDNNKGSGSGFPFQKCNGYASPLRADVHMPSCYNPNAGLTDYKNNMVWPSRTGASNGRRKNCPPGYIHVPHIFLEVYWNTPLFDSRWTPDGKSQPFVLSNGDVTGFSSHFDFMSGWDEETLQGIIDNCDVGTKGMKHCPGLKFGANEQKCTIPSEVDEKIDGVLDSLPGVNPLAGWEYGSASPPPPSEPAPAPAPAPVPAPAPAPAPAPPAPVPAPPPQEAPAPPPAAPPAPVEPEPTPSPIVVPPPPPSLPTTTTKTAQECKLEIKTVWETVTVYGTATEHASGPRPTAAAAVNGTKTVEGYAYAGCFKDGRERTLAGKVRPNLGDMTNELCVAYCKEAGWSLAGTEYSGECYCGNELVGSEKIDEAECSHPCKGDEASTCGGDWALSVYSVDGEASLKGGAAYKQRRRHVHHHARRHGSRP